MERVPHNKALIPSGDRARLTELTEATRAATHRLADHMLADLSLQTNAVMHELQAAGWRVALEVSADQHGNSAIALTMVSAEGRRRVMAEIAEAPGASGAH